MPTMRRLILVEVRGVTCENGWTVDEAFKLADDRRFVDLDPEVLEMAAEVLAGNSNAIRPTKAKILRTAARALRGE